jgi:hypothetical protein
MSKPNQQSNQSGNALPNPDITAVLSRASKELAQDLGYARDNLRDATKELGHLVKQMQDGLGPSSKLKNFAKDNLALTKDLTALYLEEVDLKRDLVLKETMYNTGLKGNYAQMLATAQLEGQHTEEQLKALTKELQARQQAADLQAKQVELIESMAEWQLEMNQELESYTMGWEKLKSKVKAIVTDPQLAKTVFAAEGIKTITKGLTKFTEGFDKLREKGLSAGQAAAGQMKSISALSILGLSDTQGVLNGMVETYGNINALSRSEVDEVGHLAHEMGIAGDAAFKLQAGLSQMPGETLHTAKNAMKYANELAKVNGLAPGKIAEDMAKNTEAMALYSKNGAKGFAEAAVHAHKMGIDIGIASKMADGLLNFEDSINKQMEASVLLGREINLDKARELALSGDAVGASAEVLKNIGGQAEFEKMNVVQKKALADATGMTVEQLAKAADAQQEYNKYHGEDVSMWMKGLGFVTETGSKVGGFLKENGMLLLSGLSVMKQYGGGLNIVKGAMGKLGGLFGKKSPVSSVTGAVTGAGDKAGDLASKAKGADAKKGAGIGGFMKGLASGLKAFGKNAGEVLKGALVFAASAALLGGALALVALGYQAMGGKPETLIGLGVALAGFGISAALIGKFSSQIMQGALAMLVLGASLIPAAIAFSMLKGLDTKTLIGFSIALPLLGLAAAGLGFLIIPIGLGALALASLGVGMIAVAGGLLILQAAKGGIEVFNSLTAVAANAAGLSGVGFALMGIAAGLGAMGLAGFAAMPAIGMLIGLAAVAPALTGLMNAMHGGGEKQGGGDKMDVLIGKMDQLIGVASQGGTVNLDGRKVGDVIRLSINSSRIK